MADFINIKIKNFEHYKGRGDVKHNSWFRCSNKLLEDPELFHFDLQELMVWIYFLSIASQKNNCVIHVSYLHAEKVCRLPRHVVDSATAKLLQLKIIEKIRTRTIRGRYENVTDACFTRHNITEQDKTEHDTHEPSAGRSPRFDFDLIYKEYPRKEGKQKGIQICKREIKTIGDFELLFDAVKRYKAHVSNSKTEPKYIKHFSSFMASWRDWSDSDAGSSLEHAPHVYKLPEHLRRLAEDYQPDDGGAA